MSRFLKSARLTLRRLAPEDATHFTRLLAEDKESIRLMARMPMPLNEFTARSWIELRIRPEGRIFAVLRTEDSEFLGVMGWQGPCHEVEVGYWIGRPFWGRGYATEALGLLIDHARRAHVERMVAETFMDNPASARVLAKAGFTENGLAVRDFPSHGGTRTVRVHYLNLQADRAWRVLHG